jgi:hypothetical protein
MPVTLIRKGQLGPLNIVNADIASNAAIATSKLADGANFILKDGSVAMTGALQMGNNLITGLATPTNSTDAATKGYVDTRVDSLAQGIDVRESVKAATTGSETTYSFNVGDQLVSITSGGGLIDGVAVAVNDRILVKNCPAVSGAGATTNTNTINNGIYRVTAVNSNVISVVRAVDADTSAEVTAGMFTFVTQGSTQADQGYVLITNDPITLGTSTLEFAQFSGAGQIIAGDGLTKTGNTINAVGTANRILVTADAIDIAANYAGQNTITTVGTIATGTWQGTQIVDAYLAGISGSKVSGNIPGNAANVTGTVAVGNGGTGATSLTGVVIGNGASAMTAVTGTASQVLRRNAGNTAFEFATLDATSVGALSSSTSSTQNGYFGNIYLQDDTSPSHYLEITVGDNLTGARTLTIDPKDASRTITLSGNLTLNGNATIVGTNTGDQTITLTGDVTGSGTGSFAATIANNAVTYAKFQQVAGLSVVGNATNATANAANITASSDGQVLRRSGTAIGFGALDLSSANSVVNKLGVTNIATAANGVVAIVNYIVRETPAGTINGSNTTFTLASTPVSNTEQVFVNGVLQNPGAGNDYTISTTTITFLSGAIPQTGDIVRVTYIKNDSI